MTGIHTLNETEQAVRERLGDLPIDFEAMAVVSNIYRASNAIRNHVETTVLRPSGLTWTGFVVLWVVWIWGEMETRHVAAEAGITKGTLTGVVKTLEGHDLVSRNEHPDDGRLVLLRLTPQGKRLMRKLFPKFNQEESFAVAGLDDETQRTLADGLRTMVRQVEGSNAERRSARKPKAASQT